MSGPSAPKFRLLKQSTGLPGAVVIGLGSILGTGVFVSLAVAAGPGGALLPLAVVVAGLLAAANGLSSAQLASAHPVSGGTYEYGYRLLSPAAGFAAGWLFLCAKSASAAAAALGIAAYTANLLGLDNPAMAWIAPVAVLTVTAAAGAGMRRSNRINAVLVIATVLALICFVVGAMVLALENGAVAQSSTVELPGLLESTALVFVAFTGYGRIATMGEEVRNPGWTIPRAVVLTLCVAMLLYLAVAEAGLKLAGPAGFAGSVGDRSASPLSSMLADAGWLFGAKLLAFGALLALFGVLLNLVLGLSRVWLAMARRADMPIQLATVNKDGTSPVQATVVTGIVIALLTLPGDLKLAWSFSAFTVLGYYAITNLAALRLPAEQRRFPRWVAWAGLVGCLGLAFFVDTQAWMMGLGVLAVGICWHLIRRGARLLRAAQ